MKNTWDTTSTKITRDIKITSSFSLHRLHHAFRTARERLVRVTVAIERESDHPLAQAIVDGLIEELDGPAPNATAVEALTGYGVQGLVEGQQIFVGKPDLFQEHLSRPLPVDVAEAIERFADGGRTTVVVASAEHFIGVLGLMDPPRDSAKPTLARLRQLGVTRTLMLTGDHQRAADGVAELVGLSEARGRLASRRFQCSSASAEMTDHSTQVPGMAFYDCTEA